MLSASGHSFDEFVLPRRGEMLNLARRLAGDAARAEDIVQDALVRALLAWPQWTPVEGAEVGHAARGWLYRIVSNTFTKDYHYRRRRREEFAQRHDEVVDAMYARPVEPGVQDEYEAVRTTVAELAPTHREVIERHYFQDQEVLAIAAEMSTAEGTVMSRLWRARRALKVALSSVGAVSPALVPEPDGASLRVLETSSTPSKPPNASPEPRAIALPEQNVLARSA